MSNAFDLTVEAMRNEGLNSDQILEELSKLFRNWLNCTNKFGAKETEREKIKNLLREIYMPTHVSGYNYWIEAIQMYKEYGKVTLTTVIYPQIAKNSGTTSDGVQIAMKRAVQEAFRICPAEIMTSVIGSPISFKRGVPTNSEFLSIIVDKI